MAVILQLKVSTTPTVVVAGFVVQVVTPAVPATDQVTVPAGVAAPTPVTVAVKARFAPNPPLPAPVRTTPPTGAIFPTETVTGLVADNAK